MRKWFFHDFVDSPDPRFRKIVKRFAEAGCVEAQKDEFCHTMNLPVGGSIFSPQFPPNRSSAVVPVSYKPGAGVWLSARPPSRILRAKWNTTMIDSPALPAPTEFKDRSTGLILFGILGILLGCLCALLVPMMVLEQIMSAKTMGGAPNLRMTTPGMMMYALLAVTFIWLGIRSTRHH
jgi:hypothetical protein